MGRPKIYEGDEKQRRRQAALVDYEKHKKERQEKWKERREQRKLELNARRKEIYWQNPEKYRKYAREHHYKKRPEENQKLREAYALHKKDPNFRIEERLRCVEKHKQLRISAYIKLGGKCHRCGNEDQRVLEMHHKIPKIRKKMGTQGWSDKELRQLLKMSEEEANNFGLLLCANCHKIIEYEKKHVR